MNFSYDPDEIEIRLPFYRFIFGGLWTQVFYSSYSNKFFNISFYEQIFLQIFVAKGNTGRFFLRNNNL